MVRIREPPKQRDHKHPISGEKLTYTIDAMIKKPEEYPDADYGGLKQ